MNIIEFKNVTEKFKLYKYKQNSLLGHVVGLFTLKERDRTEFIALDNINLSINKGETIGIIGENGSGKTTLLKLIAGILKTDEGSVKVH
jgi:ABC-type polysaccharide/polyol phosphate transport system ATPase subunit